MSGRPHLLSVDIPSRLTAYLLICLYIYSFVYPLNPISNDISSRAAEDDLWDGTFAAADVREPLLLWSCDQLHLRSLLKDVYVQVGEQWKGATCQVGVGQIADTHCVSMETHNITAEGTL